MPSPAGGGAGIVVARNLNLDQESIHTSPKGTLHRLVARAVGASNNQPTNNWAKSPGAIAGFTIVFSIVAVACVYLLWRGPNRKAFPCINRNKNKTVVDAEDASDEYVQDSRGPANWRDTIVRKEAFFPVRKAGSTDMLSEKDSGYELQPRTESMYSYDSKYTTMTGKSRRTSRASRSSYHDQGQRLSRASNHELNRMSAGFPRRPPSVGTDLATPQSVYSVYSTNNGFLGTPTEMFGLPAQSSSNSYSPRSPRSPRSPTSAQQTDYFGPSATASSSNNGMLGVTSPQAAASRNSLVRKSVGVPSPLSQSASTPNGESAPARAPGHRKSRTVSFVDNDAVSVISNVSRHSRSGSSPPRGSRNTPQFSPGAQQQQHPVPPVPSLFGHAIAPGPNETGAPSMSRPSWAGAGATSPPPLSPPTSRLPMGAAESVSELPDGAYPPNHPVALAHQKLSSASESPPFPSSATMASQRFPGPLPSFAAAPASPPAVAVRSPTTPGSPGRIPSAPGYHSRLSSRSSSLAAAAAAATTPPSNGGGHTKPQFGSTSPETSTAPTSREGSSSPPSSQNHYSTPPSSVPSHGSAPNSRAAAKGHRKNNSSNSTTVDGGGGSLDSHSASSHRSHKRGLWFDSISETGAFDMQAQTKV